MSLVYIYCASVYLSCNPRLVYHFVFRLFSCNGFICNIIFFCFLVLLNCNRFFCIVLLWKHDKMLTKMHSCADTFLLDHVVVLAPDLISRLCGLCVVCVVLSDILINILEPLCGASVF